MDNLNQLGKHLNENRDVTDEALNKNKSIIPQIERTRDVMDYTMPFEMEFKTLREGHRVLLDLNFLPPPKTGCCAECFCSICEFFNGGITETLYQVTYAYVGGSVHVFNDETEITEFIESDPTLGQVTVWAQNLTRVIICYVYDVCIGGALPTSDTGGIDPTTPPPPPPWQVPPPPPDPTGPSNLSGVSGDSQVILYWN